MSFYIFDGNYKELNQKIKSLDPNNLIIKFSDEKELFRALHNYLAALYSLKEICRVLIRKLLANYYVGFSNEYQAKINETFTKNFIPLFLEGLRNYWQHYNIPKPLLIETAEKRWTLHLLKEDLIQWEAWSKKGKDYLEELEGNSVPLEEILENYHNTVSSFYDWLGQKLDENHRTKYGD